MKKVCTFLLISFALCTKISAQSFTRNWADCYTDPLGASIQVTDMATDKTGNSYIVGYKTNPGDQYYQTHMYLRKVNAAGAEEWIQYFNAAQDSIDNAKAVEVDSKGNIYVTGTRIDTFCNICTQRSKISDIVTMKYNKNGKRIWLNRYKAGDYILSSPKDIYVTANGSTIVAGNELVYNAATFTYVNNMVLQKISPNGQTLLIKKLNQTVANTACEDKQSNIIVAGAYDPDNLYQTYKPYALKIDQAGNVLWSTIFNEMNKNGQLYTVFTDAANNIYANGQTDTLTFFNIPRIITIKYNKNGAIVWNRKEDAKSYTMPSVYGNFTIDAAGNSYVAGKLTVSDFNDDWLISKYNSSGAKQWTSYFNGTQNAYDVPADIETDSSGNVFVTGYTYATPNGKYYYALNVYNASGVLQYQDLYHNGNSFSNFANAVELDAAGNAYVTGITSNGACTLKYAKTVFAKASVVNELKLTAYTIPLRLYPNPVKDVMNIQLNINSGAGLNYEIINSNGETVIRQSGLTGKTNTAVNVKTLTAGIYLVRVTDGFKNYVAKFIKE